MKKVMLFFVFLGNGCLVAQTNFNEVPVVAGFQASSVRGELNLTSIPDYTLPAGKVLVWDMPAENRARFNGNNDRLHIFKKGYTHLEKKYHIAGTDFYDVPSLGLPPASWQSALPKKNRARMPSHTYILDNTTTEYGNIIGGEQFGDWYNDPRSPSSPGQETNAFSIEMTDWECCGGVDNHNKKLAYIWSRTQFNNPNSTPTTIGSYDMGPLFFFRWHPEDAGSWCSRPSAHPNHIVGNPMDNPTAYVDPLWMQAAQVTQNSQDRHCPTELYGKTLADITDFTSIELYPDVHELMPDGIYNYQEINETYTINHANNWFEDNWLFRLTAEIEVSKKYNNGKPLIPTMQLWAFPLQRITGCGNAILPSPYHNYTDYYLADAGPSAHIIEVPKNMAEAQAIFPFMLGCKGMWMWQWKARGNEVAPYTGNVDSPDFAEHYQDGSFNINASRLHYSPVEHFTHATYRLFGANADMFDGTENYLMDATEVSFDNGASWHQWNAVEYFQNQKPFVCAVVKGTDILVAAQSMYADPSFTQNIQVRYNGWIGSFTLNGDNVYLGRASMINTVVNIAPVASNDNSSVIAGNNVSINIINNDIDNDGTLNTSAIDLDVNQAGIQNTFTNAGQGTFQINANGILTFTPSPSFIGTSVLSYTIKDNLGVNSNIATVTVVVQQDPFIHTALEPGSGWRYWDRGSLPAASWNTPSYDDNAWNIGDAEFGYGDGDEVTPVYYGTDGQNKYITTYFRKTLTISSIPANTTMQGKLKIDDGAVVYINGAQVYKDNLPAGNIDYTTLALDAYLNENAWRTFPINDGVLQQGLNTIAVEMHQASGLSSDVSFDMKIVATNPISISTVGINTTHAGLLFYPNPAKDILYITNIDTKIQNVSVVNTIGQVIASYKEMPTYLDTKDFANGVYYINYTLNKEEKHQKFIISK